MSKPQHLGLKQVLQYYILWVKIRGLVLNFQGMNQQTNKKLSSD